jgi:hypothetical protein
MHLLLKRETQKRLNALYNYLMKGRWQQEDIHDR